MLRRSPLRAKSAVRPPRADRSAEFVSVKPPAPRADVRMATALEQRAPATVEKDEPHYSEAWRRAVASLPRCVRCDRQMVSEHSGESGTQAAHRNQGKGMGQKVDDCLTAAMCPDCHREIDQGKELTREERRREIDTAILKTLVLLFRAGKVKAVT